MLLGMKKLRSTKVRAMIDAGHSANFHFAKKIITSFRFTETKPSSTLFGMH